MSNNPIYHHDTIEFVTVAAQFCAYLEQSEGRSRKEFEETQLRLLPLLYMKATLLPQVDTEGDFVPDDQVTEADYDYIRNIVYQIMGKDDDYEDLCWDEDMQTEESRWKSISEDLADLYQALRNFVAVYQQGVEVCMMDALWNLRENFEIYWGRVLVDALRQLHRKHYHSTDVDDEEDYL